MLGTDNSSWRVLHLSSALVRQYSVQTLTSACLLLSTLVPQYSVRTTHHGLFISQYISTVVLGTDDSSRHVYLLSTLVLQCSVRTTHHGMFICLVPQCLFVQCLSALVPQYSVQTLATARLFAQYFSTVVLDTDNSSWLVYLLSMLVPQYSVRTTHHGVFYIFSVPYYVSTLVLGRDTLLRLVLHLLSALVRYYLSTRNRHSPRHVYLLSTLHRKKHLIPKVKSQ